LDNKQEGNQLALPMQI